MIANERNAAIASQLIKVTIIFNIWRHSTSVPVQT